MVKVNGLVLHAWAFYFYICLIREMYIVYYEKRIICINRDLGWSEKKGEHVGFEFRFIHIQFFLFLIREIYTPCYEKRIHLSNRVYLND